MSPHHPLFSELCKGEVGSAHETRLGPDPPGSELISAIVGEAQITPLHFDIDLTVELTRKRDTHAWGVFFLLFRVDSSEFIFLFQVLRMGILTLPLPSS